MDEFCGNVKIAIKTKEGVLWCAHSHCPILNIDPRLTFIHVDVDEAPDLRSPVDEGDVG